jgi:hypothetical protein
MKRALNLLFLAGALTLLPAHCAMARQSTAQVAGDPQGKTSNRASSHDRRHHGHSNTTRRHRHHKTSSKH